MATYWENSCSFGLRYVLSYNVPDCYFGFFPPRFLEWESFSDCVCSRSLPTCTFLNRMFGKIIQKQFFVQAEIKSQVNSPLDARFTSSQTFI